MRRRAQTPPTAARSRLPACRWAPAVVAAAGSRRPVAAGRCRPGADAQRRSTIVHRPEVGEVAGGGGRRAQQPGIRARVVASVEQPHARRRRHGQRRARVVDVIDAALVVRERGEVRPVAIAREPDADRRPHAVGLPVELDAGIAGLRVRRTRVGTRRRGLHACQRGGARCRRDPFRPAHPASFASALPASKHGGPSEATRTETLTPYAAGATRCAGRSLPPARSCRGRAGRRRARGRARRRPPRARWRRRRSRWRRPGRRCCAGLLTASSSSRPVPARRTPANTKSASSSPLHR